jgi:Lrp/AsnC family leucine-responsive transcriptional regulator
MPDPERQTPAGVYASATSAADATDSRIIAQLAADGRRTNRDVARTLGLSERLVGLRIRRLRDQDAMRIVAAVDMQAAGFGTVVNVGVRVSGRPAEDVASELANEPQILSVLLMSGASDLEIVAVAHDHASFVDFVERVLHRQPGIQSLAPSYRLRVLKVEPGMAPIVQPPQTLLDFPAHCPLDATARAIITHLWQDPRATNQDIARKMQSSETTVRARIADLRSRGILRITALNNLPIDERHAFAAVGIEVAPGRADDVAGALLTSAEVRFAATVFGRYHMLAMIVAPNAARLSQIVHSRLAHTPGVTRVEVAQALRFVKHDYRWSPTVGPDVPAMPFVTS